MKEYEAVLNDISESYECRLGGTHADRRRSVDTLFQRYFNGRVKPIAEAIACGAAVSALWSGNTFDPSRLDKQELEAFQLAFPNIQIEDISSYSGESLDGLLTAWKGKLFEVKVRDSLNDGDWIGNLHLSAGQRATLAESPTQPGWDLAIMNSDGSVAEQIQLKSTDFVSYVESAAERYPGIPILTTAEASDAYSPQSEISHSEISDANLEQQLTDVTSTSLIDSVWDVLLPGIPLALNLYWVAKGERTAEQATRAVAASAGAITAATAAHDVIGDIAADVLLDVALGFGVGFLARKLFGWLFSGDNDIKRQPEKVIDKEALAQHMHRAAMQVEVLGKSYLALPAPVSA